MKMKFREDYLDMNHSVLELILNLSGDVINQGKLNPKSVLFNRKKSQNENNPHDWRNFFRKNTLSENRSGIRFEDQQRKSDKKWRNQFENSIRNREQQKVSLVIGKDLCANYIQ